MAAITMLFAVEATAADGFPLSCSLPYADIAPDPPGHEIDQECGLEGTSSKAAVRIQNTAKNNLCAQGQSALVTKLSFVRLQEAVDAAGIEYGNASNPPSDRAALAGLHTTSEGNTIGEGSLVRFAAFLLDAHYSNVSNGESVNCKKKGRVNNDIHIALAESRNASDCQTITAEIIPHYRPDFWEPDILETIENPVRMTGHLFFDGSHKPCTPGHRASPARVSVWEIHPVYAIDVCLNENLAQCDAANDAAWVPLHEWTGTEEPEEE